MKETASASFTIRVYFWYVDLGAIRSFTLSKNVKNVFVFIYNKEVILSIYKE